MVCWTEVNTFVLAELMLNRGLCKLITGVLEQSPSMHQKSNLHFQPQTYTTTFTEPYDLKRQLTQTKCRGGHNHPWGGRSGAARPVD